MSDHTAGTKQLVLVPAAITLGVTLLRLVGELLDWSPLLFNKEAGGGGALVGIAWLVPVFGAWFGWRLARAGAADRLLRGTVFRGLGMNIDAGLEVTLGQGGGDPFPGFRGISAGVPGELRVAEPDPRARC